MTESSIRKRIKDLREILDHSTVGQRVLSFEASRVFLDIKTGKAYLTLSDIFDGLEECPTAEPSSEGSAVVSSHDPATGDSRNNTRKG